MISVLFTIDGSVMNALDFSGTNLPFSKLMNHGGKRRKRNDLAVETLQWAREKWNKDRMKRLDFIAK